MRRPQVFVIATGLSILTGLVILNPSNGLDQTSQAIESDSVESAPVTRAQDQHVAANGSSATLVGRKVCGECHQKNYALHSQHGHASTFHTVAETGLGQLFDGTKFDAGKGYGTYEYEADQDGQLIARLKSRFGDEPFPLQYALGSGLHAQTMLTLVTGVDGQPEGIEHRVSCYPDSRIAMTPGHSKMQPQQALEFFGDASSGDPLARCIYCHTTSGRIAKEQVVDLVANVNCEKCHGPGSEHVHQARDNSNPPPFSVGRSQWDTESEIQLCGDCHRMPRNITDKKLRMYPDELARFQPIGMLRSRCYLASERQMRCTTCHNPHEAIGESTTRDHEQKCIQCHQENHSEKVACPESPKEGCIECHMPALKIDENLQFHDHWIRIRGD